MSFTVDKGDCITFTTFNRKGKKFFSGVEPLQWVNRFFLALMTGSAVILFWNLWRLVSPVRKPSAENLNSSPGRILSRRNAEPMETVVNDLIRHNPFRQARTPRPPAPKITALPAPPPPPRIPLSQRISHLRLVGIIDGDPLQAVVEDRQAQRTEYLKTGDKAGEVTVQQVLPDRVIFFYDGETLEFVL